jgi:selT/selW/selH-like putative selenoprotein
LIRGSGGIFDVIVDGATIYSKHQTGQFPTEHAIVDSLRKGSR